jgi:hypothetical protein
MTKYVLADWPGRTVNSKSWYACDLALFEADMVFSPVKDVKADRGL